jgi:hypothetical protein
MPTTGNRTALRPSHMPDPAGDPGTASSAWRLTITRIRHDDREGRSVII